MAELFIIDHGNGQVKAKSSKRELLAKSAYSFADALGADVFTDTDKLPADVHIYESAEQRGDKFAWGAGIVDAVQNTALINSYTLDDRYNAQPYRLLTSMILAELASDFGDTVEAVVVTGVPSAEYGTKAQAQLEATLSGSHLVTRDGQDIVVKVKAVHVLPQTVGALFVPIYEQKRSELKQAYVGVIDIGSGTAVADGYLKLKRQHGDSFTFNDGMMSVYKEIAATIKRENPNVRPTVRDIERLLTDTTYDGTFRPTLRVEVDVEDIVNKAVDRYVQKLVGEVNVSWPDVSKFDAIYLAGGGAHVVGKALAKRLDGAQVIADADTANLRGFQIYGETLMAKAAAQAGK